MSKLGKPKFNPHNTFDPSLRRVSSAGAVVQPVVSQDALALASLYHPPLHPLQYNTAAPRPFRVMHAPHERNADELFLNETVRAELTARNDATLQVLPVSSLPEFVHVYHSLMPLDLGSGAKDSAVFKGECYRYKAVSHANGRTYCLLRIDGFDASGDERRIQLVNKWKRVRSASIVGVVEAFTTAAFGVSSLVVVHEFYPLARQLSSLKGVSDQSLWLIAAQLFQAIQTVHSRGLAVRLVDEKFILLNNNDRVRLGSVGVLDVLQPQENELDELREKDFADFAKLLTRLAPFNHSRELSDLVAALEANEIAEVEKQLAPYALRALDVALSKVDVLESDMSMELESGRVFRLLAKVEFALAHLTDTTKLGENYCLRLFKQYLFGQKTVDGKPDLNLAHALQILNKLDAGIDENVLLTDSEGTRMIISYKELKAKFSYAFDRMVSARSS